MTLPSPVKEPKNNTKAIIIVSIVFSIVAIIALAVAAALFLSAPAIDDTDNTNDGADISKETVPPVTDFMIEQTEGLEATYTFNVETIPDNYYLEYKVEDNLLRALDDGTVREPGTTENKVLLKSGSESVYLMLRATDGTNYSRWVTAGSATVETTNSEKTERAVSEAFYTTSWAQKNDSSVEALADALNKAFNIEVFTNIYAEELQGCFWGNKAEIVAGEIVRPQPDLGDNEYTLKASVYQKDATIFEITYYWCE